MSACIDEIFRARPLFESKVCLILFKVSSELVLCFMIEVSNSRLKLNCVQIDCGFLFAMKQKVGKEESQDRERFVAIRAHRPRGRQHVMKCAKCLNRDLSTFRGQSQTFPGLLSIYSQVTPCAGRTQSAWYSTEAIRDLQSRGYSPTVANQFSVWRPLHPRYNTAWPGPAGSRSRITNSTVQRHEMAVMKPRVAPFKWLFRLIMHRHVQLLPKCLHKLLFLTAQHV